MACPGKSFDSLPNFTASDVLRLLSIGRNEYIATLNECRVKGWRWRVNKARLRSRIAAKPPARVACEPYWIVEPHKLDPDTLGALTCDACAQACRSHPSCA